MRAFSLFDEDKSGELDFREFVISLWNYCTFDKNDLVKFAFDLYDMDQSGIIDEDVSSEKKATSSQSAYT